MFIFPLFLLQVSKATCLMTSAINPLTTSSHTMPQTSMAVQRTCIVVGGITTVHTLILMDTTILMESTVLVHLVSMMVSTGKIGWDMTTVSSQ